MTKNTVKPKLPKNLKINLGCGTHRMEGFHGVDILPGPATDFVCNIEEGLPFPDSTVHEMYCSNVLEHINDLPRIMKEMWRVSADGAIITIIVPHVGGSGAFQDPTHVNFFTYHTFDYFTENPNFPHYNLPTGFTIQKRRIGFVRTPKNIWDYLKRPFSAAMEFFVQYIPDAYERTILRAYPSTDLRVVLKVVKNAGK